MDYDCDELLSAFLLDLPEDGYDAIEALCKRYDELKPKLQPYFPNFDYLLRCFVSLSELLQDRGLSIEEPPLTGNLNYDIDIVDKYFETAADTVARLRVLNRVAELRHEIHTEVQRRKGRA